MADKTYFFDITDIYIYLERESTVSGIQRVAFEVISRAIGSLGTDKVWLAYWNPHKAEYLAIPTTFLQDATEFTPEYLTQLFFGRTIRTEQQTAPTLSRYRNKPLKYKFHWMKQSYYAWRKDNAYFQRRGSSLAEWEAFREEKPEVETPQASIHSSMVPISTLVKEGDPLILLGALWNIHGFYDEIKSLRDTYKVHVTQLVHDLIPALKPEHLADKFSFEFYYWLETTAKVCDSFMANSENTARDLRVFMTEVGVEKPVSVVPLAQAFTAFKPPKDPGDKPIKSYLKTAGAVQLEILNLTKIPYVLVVGTMESRKNAWRLGQVWKRLSEDRDIDAPRLVFAGKPGWFNSDFDQLMNSTHQLGGWVQFVRGPSDAELQFLYENCLFTAMVSFYEGWGLPIGEGLSFGKTAVVGDNSSLPEVGGDMVEYCDSYSINSIYAACRRLIQDVDHRKALETRIAQTKLRTWDDVAEDVVKVVTNEHTG